jgi:hypothetical protein
MLLHDYVATGTGSARTPGRASRNLEDGLNRWCDRRNNV